MKQKFILLLIALGVSSLIYGQTYLNEGFEGASFPPAEWINTDWTQNPWTSSHAHTGDGSAYTNTIGSVLTTLPLIASAASSENLNFWYKATFSSVSISVDVMVGNDIIFQIINCNSITWIEANVSLAAYAGQTIQIKFVGLSTVDYGIFIDDISGPEVHIPSCNAPTNLTSSDETISGADLDWVDATGSHWDLYITPSGSSSPNLGTTPTINDNSSTSYTWTGGEPLTTYDWFVRSDCGMNNTDVSYWIGSEQFTTWCTAPYSQDFEGVTDPALPLSWSSIVNSTATNAGAGTTIANTHSGFKTAYLNNADDLSATLLLTTPAFNDLPSHLNRIRFFAKGFNGAILKIGTMSDPTDEATFTLFETINLTTTYTEYTVEFDASYTLTDNYIVFKNGLGGTNRSIFIDDVVWEEIPDPVYSISPESKDFGDVLLDGTSSVQTFTISNTGGGDLTINSLSITGSSADQFTLTDANTYPLNVTFGNPITVDIAFEPTSAGAKIANLHIEDNLSKTTHDVVLDGLGVNPYIESFPYSQNFDGVSTPVLPPDWSKLTDTGNEDLIVETNSYFSYSMPNSIVLGYGDETSGNLLLISPPTNLTTSNTRVKFWARSFEGTINLIVGTMSDNTNATTFTEIESITLSDEFEEYIININSNTTYIGFKHPMSSPGTYDIIDNFTWEEIPTTWTGATDQNWNDANNWNSAIPQEFTDVTIPSGLSNYPSVNGDAGNPSVCNSLTIVAGATLTIPANKALTVCGTLSNSGTLTIESTSAGNGSLIHNTASISGIFQHYILKDNTWHNISVPFSETMPEICNGDYAPLTTNFNGTTNPTYDFFLFNEAVGENNWINLKTTAGIANTSDFGSPPRFDAGTGYLVAYDNLFAGNVTKSATGTFANGSISIPLTSTNLDFNLVGNPYPSSIDWKATSGWTRDNITEDGGYNLWIWNGSSGQYGAYNSSSDSDNGTNGASRYISPGQGLYVKALSAGNLVMTNDVRVHSTKNLLKSLSTLNNFRMSVTGDQTSYSDEIMIEFDHSGNTGGAQKLHSMYSNAPSLSTTKNNANYSIDFRTSIDEQSQIPISFSAGVDGVYTFNAQLAGGFEEAILEDLQLNNKVDLTNNPQYVFGSSINDDPYRFILHFASVGIDEEIVENSLVQIWSNNNIINIINTISKLGEIKVFNLMGQTAGSFKLDGSQQQKLELNLQSGIYIVTVSTSEGSIKSEKVIISNN